MKKLEKINLSDGMRLLTREELQSVIGASGGNVCSGKHKNKCSGTCTIPDSVYTGNCGWVGGSYNSCTCMVIEIGPIEPVYD